jgi:hypothetical protein
MLLTSSDINLKNLSFKFIDKDENFLLIQGLNPTIDSLVKRSVCQIQI